MTIPKGCTHIWTPGITDPRHYFIVRRAYYKRTWGKWYSYSKTLQRWMETGNLPEWFMEERKEGYLVTVKKFTDPKFIPKKEKLT